MKCTQCQNPVTKQFIGNLQGILLFAVNGKYKFEIDRLVMQSWE
jgi:hypothetical protein